ncbi:hypothetical protein QH494_21675 [Sphingomonas sp. AR_OL41]|uniref:hypothetical protein n=1 Tax=Sphingomonas sp. AR_OL41 TaxID=3042729 RepID=UPI0024816133|nr:hypothetical protein [Sphingomonas sp. AR_OL41]MDH7974807.1 hypothetical protein [Sphingomonas sp. AR_OL41]
MTGSPGEGWKIFADGDDPENVPLWKALAQYTSDDLDEGLKANAAVIDQAKPPFVRYYNLALVVSLGFGFLSVIFLIALLISVPSRSTDLFTALALGTLAATASPHLWRQVYQYGSRTPEAPLALPYAPDRPFDEVLGYLQKASGPRAYYLSRFGKRRVVLNRRQFFGRLRYFLFSEHSMDRAIVMRFRTGLPMPADIFLHRDDVEKMLVMSKPRRKGGPGRNTKYRYADAVIALIADNRLATLNLEDRAASVRALRNWLADWFETNADASGDVPRGDQLSPYAEKIFDHLRNQAALKNR